MSLAPLSAELEKGDHAIARDPGAVLDEVDEWGAATEKFCITAHAIPVAHHIDRLDPKRLPEEATVLLVAHLKLHGAAREHSGSLKNIFVTFQVADASLVA